jgi:spermidine/putrescine transport system substrate-binding protein
VSRLKMLQEGRESASALLEGQSVSRKQFLMGMGATASAAFLASGAAPAFASRRAVAASAGTLDIYTWPDYFSAANLKHFKKQSGISITQATYESNDAMYAKLAATNGNSGFDMAIPTSGWIGVMAAKGLLQEIDHSKVPFANVNPQLLNKSFDPHNKYSVPKDYGYNGVVYDSTVITKPPKTWMDVIDLAKTTASGKFAMSIDYETISTGLWALGYSMNDTDKAHLNHAADLMKSVAPHVKTFNSFDVTGCVNGTIAMMTSDQSVARQVLLQNKKFKFVVPLPHSELWVDNYTILKNAAHTSAAYSFIDFQLKPSSQVTDTEFIGYPTVLKGLEGKLPASTKLKNVIFIPAKVYETLETYIVREDLQGYIENLSTEVQAAAG